MKNSQPRDLQIGMSVLVRRNMITGNASGSGAEFAQVMRLDDQKIGLEFDDGSLSTVPKTVFEYSRLVI